MGTLSNRSHAAFGACPAAAQAVIHPPGRQHTVKSGPTPDVFTQKRGLRVVVDVQHLQPGRIEPVRENRYKPSQDAAENRTSCSDD